MSLGCSWTHQKMREPNSSVVWEPSGSSGELYHRFLQHTRIDPRRRWISHIFVFWWHQMSLQESHEQCVQWIVRFIHSQHSPKRIAFLYDCLAMAVETSLLTPRYSTLINTSSFSAISCSQQCLLIMCFWRIVCGALIGSESLEWERTQLWALTFKLIRKIIGGVDYKVFLSEAHTSGIHCLTTLTFCISL